MSRPQVLDSTFGDALRAEWTKLRTTPQAAWLVAAIAVLTPLAGAAMAAAVSPPTGELQDPARISLTGVHVGQLLAAALAVAVIGGEHGTRMLTTTFTALPRRGGVLGAKATLVVAAVLAAGTVGAAGSALAGRALLPGNGFTPANGYATLLPVDGTTARAVLGTVVYLVLVALLGLGVAALVRDPAAAVATLLAVLYAFPLAANATTDPPLRRRLLQLSPMDAGLTVQDTIPHPDHLRPAAGLAVLAAWTAVALTAGAVALLRRDAP